jgi:bacteriocin biosynthesis cyclodehydratase domain-containing protein
MSGSIGAGPRVPRTTSGLPERPLLSGLYHVVPLGRDRVQVVNAGRAVVFSRKEAGSRLASLLEALDGTATTVELKERFPDLVPSALEALAGKGLLLEGSGSDQALGPRGVAAALGVAEPGRMPSVPEIAHQLTRSTVAFVGCGPVAGAAAVLLAKAGVGRLLLSDPTDVSAGDIAVSPVLGPAAAGHTHDRSTATACRTAAPTTAVCIPEREGELEACDLVVVAGGLDGGVGGQHADRCLIAGVPYLVFGQDAAQAIVGPLVLPGAPPCHRCAEERRLGNVEHLDEHLAYRRHRVDTDPGPDAFVAAHSATVAGIVATEALRVLTGVPAMTEGGAFVLDLVTTSIIREDVLPVPGCSGCAASTTGP